MTDHRKLLLAMHRGHEPSAEKLWGLFAPRLLAYAAAVLPKDQQHAADDVVQAVFCGVLTQPRRELKKIEDVSAWLFRCTRNHAMNQARGEQRERDRRESRTPETAGQPGLGVDADLLRAAVDGLPSEQREIVMLRHMGGLTLDQAATALEVNRSTLASRYQAGVRAVRDGLGIDKTQAKEADHAGA